MILSDASLKNRTTVFVVIVLIVVVGAVSYATLPRESAPEVKIPIIMVTTRYEGLSPEDIESEITNELENELTGIKGLKEIRSTSAEGVSLIQLEFYPDMRIEDALRRVKDKVDVAEAELSTDRDRGKPIVSEINLSEFPIMMINVSGKVSPVKLKFIADRLEDHIKRIPGVLAVDILGALEREIRIEIDPDRLAAYGLTVEEVLALVPTENVNVSAGGLATAGTKFNVRVQGEFEKPEKINTLMIAERNGRPIYLTDVATVRDTFKDRSSFARLDGVPSITVAVRKAVGANIVELAERVKAILAEARTRAPATVRFELTDDQSKDINMMVSDLENNILSGLILVVLVLVLFMGLRSSIIVALAIPMSMLMSFAIIQVLGYTLNMVILFSLILALGMLVDNAIVIVENVFRHRQLGKDRLAAARAGAAEVAWPVITSTATTVAAFAPLLFWPDVMGDFMKYLPIGVIITLCSSLFVALVISPVIASLFGGGTARRPKAHARHHWFTGGYRKVLAGAIEHRLATIALSGLLLAGIGIFYVRRGAGKELFPKIDPGRAMLNLRTPQGTNIHDVNELAGAIEQRLQRHRLDRTGSRVVLHVVTNVGGGGGTMFDPRGGRPNEANLTMLMVDHADRKRPATETVDAVRADLVDIPGAEVKVEREQKGPPTGSAVTVRIIGPDLKELRRLSDRARHLILDVPIPGLVNLRGDLEDARPELRFEVDRERAKRLGVNTFVIGNFLKTAIFGVKVGSFRVYTDDYDITVRLPESQRRNIEDLQRLRVPNRAGRSVPLSSLGRFRYAPGMGTIRRIDQKRVVELTADAEGRLDSDVFDDAQKRLAGFELPPGYEIRYAGKKEEEEKAVNFLFLRALPIALLVIVGILVTQFNTLSAPLIIMCTVVLSTIGVFIGLLIFDMPFGIIMTGVGVISLAGVVVNNAIVLLDYTRKLQRIGMDVVAASLEAGVTRLRPVLLTATTTILGLAPMATGVSFDFHTLSIATRSESSQWWASMAIAVIFGLAFATILTLLVVPALHVTLYRLTARMGFGDLHRDKQTTTQELPSPLPQAR